MTNHFPPSGPANYPTTMVPLPFPPKNRRWVGKTLALIVAFVVGLIIGVASNSGSKLAEVRSAPPPWRPPGPLRLPRQLSSF